MNISTSVSIGLIVVGGWLATSVAWGVPSSDPPRAGGIPRCEAELAECNINLTEIEGLLKVCEKALVECQATQGQAFPATGQTSCWDSLGSTIDCAGTGNDGDIRAGANLSYTDNGVTITDNNTKLESMKQDDNDLLGTNLLVCDGITYPGNLDKDCRFTWDEAFTFVANLNVNNHAGYSDWRVPNVKELHSIVNYENFEPAVAAEFNTGCVAGCTVDDPENECSCTAASFYWTSTSGARPVAAWVVFFRGGGVHDTAKSGSIIHLRAVRGGLID